MPQQPDPRLLPDTEDDPRLLPDTPEPSGLKKAWNFATSPLLEFPSDIGRSIADWYTEPTLANSPTGEGGFHDYMAGVSARARGLLGGMAEGVGDVVSGLSSPINLATMGAFGGGSVAARSGLPAIGKALNYTGKALSAPVAYEGGSKLLSPESSLIERGLGLAELAGGMAGMLHTPTAARRGPGATETPAIEPELSLRPPVNPALAKSLEGAEQPALPGFDDINFSTVKKTPPVETPIIKPDDIHAAYGEGRIDQKTALNLLNEYYRKEAATAKKPAPVTTEAGPTVPKPPGVQETVDLIKSGQIKNVADLQKETGLSFNATKVIWYAAKEKIKAAEKTTTSKVTRISNELTPEEQALVESYGPDTYEAEQALAEVRGDIETTSVEADAFYKEMRQALDEGNIVYGPKAWNEVQQSLDEGWTINRKLSDGSFVLSRPGTKQSQSTIKVPRGEADKTYIQSLRKDGYEFQGLDEEGNYVFGRAESAAKEAPGFESKFKGATDEALAGEAGFAERLKSEKGELTIREDWREKLIREIPDEELPTVEKLLKELGAEEFRRRVIHRAESDRIEMLKTLSFKERLKSEKGELVIERKEPKKTLGPTESGRIIIKSAQATPEVVKRLYDKGYRWIGENEKGDLRFQKSAPIGQAPILEQDVLPTKKEKLPKDTDVGIPRQIYDLSRGLMSVDPPFITSAAFRQAQPWVGTKNWFKSWASAAKAFGEKEWYDARMKQIEESPLFKVRRLPDGTEAKSFAQEIGIRMTDLKDAKSSRAQGIKSQLAERLPVVGRYVSASNRAFSAFLNDLRYNQLEAFVKDGKILAEAHKDPRLDLTKNIPLAKEYAQFLNDTTGASNLKTGFGTHQYSLDMHAQFLADVFFSPRLMASRIRMLNPSTYIMANPAVRKQYLHAMLRTIATWWGIAQLGQLAGGKVNTDPNNPDFGKIKIGNTRLDPGAGFQQFLVLGSRIKPDWMHLPIERTDTGIVPLDLTTGFLGTPGGRYSSSISGISRPFGTGFNPPTRTSAIGDFMSQKLHPTAKLIFDIGAANERKPVYLMDRIAQLYVPMMTGDIIELMDENPELIPLVVPFSGVGGGSQTYTGAPTTPVITPMFGLDRYDVKFSGGKK